MFPWTKQLRSPEIWTLLRATFAGLGFSKRADVRGVEAWVKEVSPGIYFSLRVLEVDPEDIRIAAGLECGAFLSAIDRAFRDHASECESVFARKLTNDDRGSLAHVLLFSFSGDDAESVEGQRRALMNFRGEIVALHNEISREFAEWDGVYRGILPGGVVFRNFVIIESVWAYLFVCRKAGVPINDAAKTWNRVVNNNVGSCYMRTYRLLTAEIVAMFFGCVDGEA